MDELGIFVSVVRLFLVMLADALLGVVARIIVRWAAIGAGRIEAHWLKRLLCRPVYHLHSWWRARQVHKLYKPAARPEPARPPKPPADCGCGE